MEEHILGVTKVVNWLLGKPAAALLVALHIQSENHAYPIPNHVAMEFVVFFVAVVFFLWLKGRLSVEQPGGVQQCMELVLTNPMRLGVRDLLDSNVRHGAEKYIPMLGSIGLFVLLCNLISLVPGFESPTANNSVPFACAIVVFLYYNWCGIRHHGPLGYGFEFVKMPIEVISHAARLLSLTVRLWVNMMVSELLYGIFLGLLLEFFLFFRDFHFSGWLRFLNLVHFLNNVSVVFPLVIPIAFIALHAFVGILQAFVFTILPVIYVAGAVKEEH